MIEPRLIMTRIRSRTVAAMVMIGLVLLGATAHAFDLYSSDNVSFGLKGYYKNLFFSSKRQATDTWYVADLNRIRTEWDAKFFHILSTKVIWDHEVIGGDYVNTEEFARRQTIRADPYLDMDYEIVRRNDFFYGQQIYRAYARVDAGPVVFIAGRQQVGWGVMRLFAPTDLFTRLPIFDIEKDERVGVMAANLAVNITPSLRINPVYVVNPDFDRSRIGGRLTQTVGHFDLSVLGGKFLQDEVFGFDFSGDVKKIGVRGEFIYDRAEFGDDFVQFSAGVDYGFENTFYFALEYFYNGQAAGSQAASRGTALATARSGSQIQSIHKNFIGLLVKYDFTPLWTANLMTVVDLNGGSVFFNPETKYSVLSWMDLSTGAHLPVGQGGGEFTAAPNVYYVQTQLFF